jgi:DnaJ-class molecular chaperone
VTGNRHRYEIMEAAEEVARLIAPALEQRLLQVHGPGWLAVVREQHDSRPRRPSNAPRPQAARERSLRDERFCLAIFAYNEASEDWAPEPVRCMANRLNALANAAHHNDPLTDHDCRQARRIAEAFRSGFEAMMARPAPSHEQGEDLTADLVLDFEDAVRGARTSLHLTSDAVCSTCHGTGIENREREVKVNVPAGVDDGQRIRFRGRGGPGRNGGPPGDLYVTCRVNQHPVFGRRGYDLTLTLPVATTGLESGTVIPVPTLDGEEVKVRIPPGTPPGKTFRLVGRGLATTQVTGNLLVTVQTA